MPFSHLTLTAAKPSPDAYPETPETLGEHLRKARMDRDLLKREAAEQIGVHPVTIRNWERDRASPAVRHWPRVIEWLGFVPFEVGDTLPERIHAYRKFHGLSQKQLADRLGVVKSTVRTWERGINRPSPRLRERVEALLDRE